MRLDYTSVKLAYVTWMDYQDILDTMKQDGYLQVDRCLQQTDTGSFVPRITKTDKCKKNNAKIRDTIRSDAVHLSISQPGFCKSWHFLDGSLEAAVAN